MSDPTVTATAPAVNGASVVLVQPTATSVPTPPSEVAKLLRRINDELNVEFFERRSVIEAMLLAVLSKQHAFLFGPPGTAKSLLTRALFGRILGAEYFEALLSKTRPAEAILGPWDIPALRDRGEMIRNVAGFLPTCNFGMLDEIGKMGPTLGHDLLAVVNERRMHQVDHSTGKSWLDVPLYSLIGGSNELPTDEADDAAAMWDRLLIRVVVEPIEETGNFIALLSAGRAPTGTPTTVDFPSLAHVIDDVVPAVKLPHDVLTAIAKLRDQMKASDLVVSDRRWRACADVIRAAAFLDGRTEASTDDIGALRYCLWEHPNQISTITRMCLSVSNPFAEKALSLRERIEEQMREAKNAMGLSQDKRNNAAIAVSSDLKVLHSEAQTLKQQALQQGASVTMIEEVMALAETTRAQILETVLGI